MSSTFGGHSEASAFALVAVLDAVGATNWAVDLRATTFHLDRRMMIKLNGNDGPVLD